MRKPKTGVTGCGLIGTGGRLSALIKALAVIRTLEVLYKFGETGEAVKF